MSTMNLEVVQPNSYNSPAQVGVPVSATSSAFLQPHPQSQSYAQDNYSFGGTPQYSSITNPSTSSPRNLVNGNSGVSYSNSNNNNNFGSNLVSSSHINPAAAATTTSHSQANVNGSNQVFSGYSNSNRNLITQKFVPLGEERETTSNFYSPSFSSNGNNNNCHSQSIAVVNNGRSTGNIAITNSRLNCTTNTDSCNRNSNSNGTLPTFQDATNGTGDSHKLLPNPIINGSSSSSSNGGYQIKDRRNGLCSPVDLRSPYKPQLQVPQSNTAQWPPLAARNWSRSNSNSNYHGGRGEGESVWDRNLMYKNTGSTLESLNLSARENYSDKWGPTREEMKDQLANSLASDRNVRILPGFTGSNGESCSLPYTLSTPSINYGRREQVTASTDERDKGRLPSPVTRAQLAIGQSRRELGQVQSMMEMNKADSNGPTLSSFAGRHPRTRNVLTLDPESLVAKRTKQQSYRVELERQIEQTKMRKHEMRRLDLEGDHPLGVKYNSPIPHNYLEDCLRSPRLPVHDQSSSSSTFAKEYAKYLDHMARREVVSEDKLVRRQIPPSHTSPGFIPQQSPKQMPQKQLQLPHPYQEQYRMASAAAPNPEHYPFPMYPPAVPFYQAPIPYYPYVTPPPMQSNPFPPLDAFQNIQHQQQEPKLPNSPRYQNGPEHPLQPFHLSESQKFPQSPSPAPAHNPRHSSTSFNSRIPIQPLQPVNPINKVKTVRQAISNDSFNSLDDSNQEEIEQSLIRLHVWQESNQMPDPELKTNLYKRDLMKQIVQKKREQMNCKAKEVAEDEKLERKIQEYQEQMKKELEEERSQLNLMNQIKLKKGHNHDGVSFSMRGQPQYQSLLPNYTKHQQGVSLKNYGNPDGDGWDAKQDQVTGYDFNGNALTSETNNPANGHVDVDVESGGSSSSSSSEHISSQDLPEPVLPFAMTKTNTNALTTLKLPTLLSHNGNGIPAIAKRAESAAVPVRQRKILEDLQVLNNVSQILKMEAKRVRKEKKDLRKV